MLNKIHLKDFKCHRELSLPLLPLTVLTGFNSAGKSTVLHALCLISQSLRNVVNSNKLFINGELIKLGCFSDVLNFSGRDLLSLSVEVDDEVVGWEFTGERRDKNLSIQKVFFNDKSFIKPHDFFPFEEQCAELLPKLRRTLSRLVYISAERVGPQQTYELMDKDELVMGPSGNGTPSILYHNDTFHVAEELRIPDTSPFLERQVEAWMKKLFPGFSLDVQPVDGTSLLTMRMKTSDHDEYSLPQNVGFGLTHVLPIITACLYATPGDILLLDNPEAHLHPAGQCILVDFLARVSAIGVQVIVETHSDHIINGIRKSIKCEEVPISANHVGIHFFASSESGINQVNTIIADDEGRFDYWPVGFFDQYEKDLSYLAGWN